MQFSPFDDVNLLSFCLDSGKLNHELDELASTSSSSQSSE